MVSAIGIRALTVRPGVRGAIELAEVPAPQQGSRDLLLRTLAIGICGTDREIVDGSYGQAPPGSDRLVLGHESLMHVIDAPTTSMFATGDLVVGIVRRPDPVPCPSCAIGEWDMCRNGRYTERGIKERDGYAAELIRLNPRYAVRVPAALGALGVLAEPASVVAKAWEQIERIASRMAGWKAKRLLVTGAGPIGLLAALMGRQRKLDVHVYDRVQDGPKPSLVRDLGATYHAGELESIAQLEPDIVIECTGASQVMLEVVGNTARSGIVCLAGVASGGRQIRLDLTGLSRTIVLENDLVFGTVNANRRHYEAAIEALCAADAAWLARLITRRVPLARWREAFESRPDDVKVVVDFAAAG